MAVYFDEDGKLCFGNPEANQCPTDPQDALNCESCQ